MKKILLLFLTCFLFSIGTMFAETYTLELTTTSLGISGKGTSYDKCAGAHTVKATSTNGDTMDVTVTLTDVCESSNSGKPLQFKKSSGKITNTTDIGTIKSITIDHSSSSSNKVSSSYTGGSFTVTANSSGAGYVNKITIVFEYGSGETVDPTPDPDPNPDPDDPETSGIYDEIVIGNFSGISYTVSKSWTANKAESAGQDYSGATYTVQASSNSGFQMRTSKTTGITVTAAPDNKKVESITIEFGSPIGGGVSVYASDSPIAIGTTSGTLLGKDIASSGKVKIDAPYFIIVPASDSYTIVSKVTVKWVDATDPGLPKVYNTTFDDVTLYVGGEATITPKTAAPKGLTINYEITEGSEYVSLQGNTIKGLNIGSAEIAASWGGGETGYEEGSASFGVKVEKAPVIPTEDPQLGFRYTTVYGKAGVGFVGQAVYHQSPGKITYASSNPEVVDVNPLTGMYVSGSPCNVGETTITATIEPYEEFLGDSKSYKVVIESMEPEPTLEASDATFDFSNPASLKCDSSFKIPDSNNSTVPVPGYIFTVNNVSVVAKNENGTDPRLFYSSTTGIEYRLYKNGKLNISVPPGNSISKITFVISDAITNNTDGISSTQTNPGSISYNKNTSSPYNKREQTVNVLGSDVTSVDFSIKENIWFSKIIVTVDTPKEDAGSPVHYNISFNDDDRIISAFVGDVVTLPTLQYDPGFDTSVKIDYTVDDESDDKGEFTDCTISTDNGAVMIKGLPEGVYTVRATSEATEKQTAATAILRVNVFPRLEVLPADEEHLADDERTNAPELTLVNAQQSDEAAEPVATIKLPSVGDKYEYSTIHVQKVVICHGSEAPVVYEVKNSEISLVDAAESLDIATMPETFDFTDDGSVSYTIRYADTYEIESTVHVVLMPQTPKVDEAEGFGAYLLTASKNAMLQYCAYVDRSVSNTKKRVGFSAEVSAPSDMEWVDANANSAVVSLPEGGISKGEVYAVEFRSVKDISSIVSDNGDLYSTTGRITIEPNGTITGVENVDVDVENNAPVEYFDMQGRRVQNADKGLFIRRQGNVIEKVIL